MKIALIALLACTGCAGTAPRLPVSTFPADVVERAMRALTAQCGGAPVTIGSITPAIVNAGLSGPDEMWTTDGCATRIWLVTPQGNVHAVANP